MQQGKTMRGRCLLVLLPSLPLIDEEILWGLEQPDLMEGAPGRVRRLELDVL